MLRLKWWRWTTRHKRRSLRTWFKAPLATPFKHVPREGKAHEGRGGRSAPGYAQELLKKAQSLAEGPVLGKLHTASDDLYAWAATRVANDPGITLEALLEDMVQFGLGELAAEAAKILEEHGEDKAGSHRRCMVQDTVWSGDGPGKALAGRLTARSGRPMTIARRCRRLRSWPAY